MYTQSAFLPLPPLCVRVGDVPNLLVMVCASRPSPTALCAHEVLSLHEERALVGKIVPLHLHRRATERLKKGGSAQPTESEVAKVLGLSKRALKMQRDKAIKARNELARRNLRLVVSACARVKTNGMPREDVVQEGCVAVVRAAERFDVQKGRRFGAYARRAVLSAGMRAGCGAGAAVVLPERLCVAARRVARFRETFLRQHGVLPPDGAARVITKEPLRLVALAGRHLKGPVPLDERLEGGGSLMDIVPSNVPLPEEVVGLDMVRREVRIACYRSLPPRMAGVVVLRFGLNGGTPMLAKDIATIYGISGPRVRQIILEAFERLRRLEPGLAQLIYDL